jgi:hypothetical protein
MKEKPKAAQQQPSAIRQPSSVLKPAFLYGGFKRQQHFRTQMTVCVPGEYK